MCMNTKRHVCGICVKLKSLLKTHYRQVKGASPYPHCENPRFVYAGSRASPKLSCLICNKKFRFKTHLEAHLRNHSSTTHFVAEKELKPEYGTDDDSQGTEAICDIKVELEDQMHLHQNNPNMVHQPQLVGFNDGESQSPSYVKSVGENIKVEKEREITWGNKTENCTIPKQRTDADDSDPVCHKEFPVQNAAKDLKRLVSEDVWRSTLAELAQRQDESSPCSQCEKVFRNAKALQNHTRQKHQNPDQTLKKETVKKNWNKSQACSVCLKMFRNRKTVREHMRLVHKVHPDSVVATAESEGGNHPCSFCENVFANLWALREHTRLIHKISLEDSAKSYPCPFCPRRYKELRGLHSHTKFMHNIPWSSVDDSIKEAVKKTVEKAVEGIDDVEPPSHICTLCSKSFTNKYGLAHHMRVHTGERPHACDTCGARFGSRNNLKLHVRTHTGEKPLKCPYCERCFRQATDRKRHILTHTREYNYSCHICGKQFLTTCHLRDHLKRHSGAMNFECDQCHKFFISKYALNRHYPVHTGERTHVCDMCGSAFKWRRNLTQHKKTQHPEQYQLERDAKPQRITAEMFVRGNSATSNQGENSAKDAPQEKLAAVNLQKGSVKGNLQEVSVAGSSEEG